MSNKKSHKIKENVRNINIKKEKKNEQNINSMKKNVIKIREDVFDVCTVLDKCSIEEISKYLIEQGKNKEFPDLTKRP